MSKLSTQKLEKSYYSRRVVQGISLTVNSGEVVGLLGPNGAGKTTTFYMMVGLVPCDKGNIYLDDTEIGQLPIDKRAKLGLGYLPQEESIFRKLSVEDNILAILEARFPTSDLNTRQQRLDGLLKEFQVTHLRHSLGASLSGGERRRVEIARALATDPLFLLLDEPFAGLDPISVSDIQGMIRLLADKNIGLLITDHNVRETLLTCDRGYIVNAGTIVIADTPEQILKDSQVRKIYLGDKFTI